MDKTRIRTLGLEAKRLKEITAPGMHRVNDGPGLNGLYLQIGGPKSRSWVYRYSRNSRQRDYGLGSAFLLSIEEAATRADKARRIHLDGGDPIELRRAAKLAQRLENAKGVTFKQAAEEFVAKHSPAWKNDKHIAQWKSTLATYVYPKIGMLPIQAIDTAMVLEILNPIWLEKTETASRIAGRIKAIIDYATPQYRVGPNPAHWDILKSKLPNKQKIAKVKHHEALAYAAMPQFMADLRGRDSTSARCLEFLTLVAGRSSEVREAVWSEIDLEARSWTIPASRMKGDAEHKVPLTGRCVEILRHQAERRESDYVFPGGRDGQPMSEAALRKLIAVMGCDCTIHGFRSSFRDWVAEKTEFDRALAEKCLAHVVGDETERAYQRGDLFEKRRKLMSAWSDYCTQASPQRGKVVNMRP